MIKGISYMFLFGIGTMGSLQPQQAQIHWTTGSDTILPTDTAGKYIILHTVLYDSWSLRLQFRDDISDGLLSSIIYTYIYYCVLITTDPETPLVLDLSAKVEVHFSDQQTILDPAQTLYV